VAVMMVAAFTCVSWVCAVVMPDVFTGILLLAIIVYLFDKNKSKFTQFLYVLLMLFAVITHYSHFLIVVLFALCLLAYSLISKRRDFFKKGLVILSTGLVFYLTMCTINYADKKEFTFSRASHIFMVAHFATNGILDTYLDDSCGKKDLRLCVAKGQLSPYHWDFLWPPPSSPLSKIGIWDSCDKEFKGIVHDVFTTPAYLKMFITKSVTATCRQLYTADVERVSGPPIDDWTNLRVKDNFADEYKELALSRQHGGAIESTSFNVIYNLFFIITTIGILLIYSPRDNKELYLVYAVIAVFFVINAFVTANFSTVSARFQNRIFWILPATNAILLLKYLQNRFKTIL
jgi:hypothetical protein